MDNQIDRDFAGFSAAIESGATTSTAVDVQRFSGGGFLTPSALTGTSFTFTVSESETGVYVALYDRANSQVSTTVTTSRAYPLPPEIFNHGFFKIVSGGAEGAARTIRLSLVTLSPSGASQAGGGTSSTVAGTVADDATTPGSPVMIGGQAKETDGTDPGSVSAEDDVARLITDRNRRLLVNTAHPNLWRANENHATAQTNNVLKAAPGANLSLYITDIIISNGATAGTVKLVEDTGGTPADLAGPFYLGINGGMSKKFATPIRCTANKDIGFTSTVVTTHNITLCGYTAP